MLVFYYVLLIYKGLIICVYFFFIKIKGNLKGFYFNVLYFKIKIFINILGDYF